MENYTSNNEGIQTTKFQIIIKWVLITLVVSIATTMINFFVKNSFDAETELNIAKIVGFLSLAIISFSIFSGIKEYKNTILGDYISFGQGFKFGMTITLYLIILNSLFMIIYFNFIIDFDTFTAEQLDAAIKNLSKQNLTEEKMQSSIEMTKMFMTKGFLVGSTAIFGTFVYTIVSLISAAILKKEIKND